jgi:hypothetical protein
MVNDEQAERAVDWIRDNAATMGKARAERVYLEEYRKTLKAKLMRQSECARVADAEVFAYSHPDYVAHLEGLRAAVEQEESLRWMMVAAQAKVELYRTQESSRRAGLS